jgi:CBS domain-containing protein
MIKRYRTSDFVLHIRGVDELTVAHDSILFEACNTSFQLHLQIDPDDFISSYNWAQAISGPILSVCTNSPLLLGRELWRETRVALFQQSIDTRNYSRALKDTEARVKYGSEWETGSIAEIFKTDVAKHPIILTRDIEKDAVSLLNEGTIPKLQALALHNGTIYRWNRPCYGVADNIPHVRIECRYLPAGPTVIDEIANFAFWIGVMKGRPKRFDHMPDCMDFREAKANFFKAARTGKESLQHWCDGYYTAQSLAKKELLPMAYEGLTNSNVDKEDIERLLGVIERRVDKSTGAHWSVVNFRKLKSTVRTDDALVRLTKGMYENQEKGNPVAEWPAIEKPKELHLRSAELLGHIMSTQLFTVTRHDLAELATAVMQWKNIHHLPIEDRQGKLCGILSWKQMEAFLSEENQKETMLVSDIMEANVITMRPEDTIKDAIDVMKKNQIGCLPIVQDQHLVGIVTIQDLLMFDDGESV